MNETVTLNPMLCEKIAIMFCVGLSHVMEVESAEKPKARGLAPYVLFLVSSYLTGPGFSQEMWTAGMTSTLSVLFSRKAELPGSTETLDLPEWDPNDLSSVPYYPYADAFLNLYPFILAADHNDTNVSKYFGPVLSIAGYVLDGVKEGLSPTKKETREQLERWRKSTFRDEQEIAELSAKLDQLETIVRQAKENADI